MDPLEFIAVAIRLCNSKHEGDLRTAVSRAYYCAFHVARQFLIDCGLRFPPKEIYAAEIHRRVRYCLSESGNADAVFASGGLRELRRQRNEADYNLDSTRFKSPVAVSAMVHIAPEIIDAIGRCRLEPAISETRERLRTYARDVLRIRVEGD
jgi:uncharacterized protein (UPF0332 family)